MTTIDTLAHLRDAAAHAEFIKIITTPFGYRWRCELCKIESEVLDNLSHVEWRAVQHVIESTPAERITT